MIETFWLVWRECGGVPTHKHASEELARIEAARLAEHCPGDTFHVLKCVASCSKRTVDWFIPVDPCPYEIPDCPPF